MGVSTGSRVVPATSLTTTRSSPNSRFTKEDLPTLGFPMTATRITLFVLFIRTSFGELSHDRIQEVSGSLPRDGAQRVGVAHSQCPEIQVALVPGKVVQLVDHQEGWLRALPKDFGQLFVQGMDAGSAVHHEQDDVRLLDSRHGLFPNGPFQRFVAVLDDPAGVHYEKAAARPVGPGEVPVPGNPRRVVHDGQPPPQEPVEEGGFPHVGSAYHSHDGDLSGSQCPQGFGDLEPGITRAGAAALRNSESEKESMNRSSAFRASFGKQDQIFGPGVLDGFKKIPPGQKPGHGYRFPIELVDHWSDLNRSPGRPVPGAEPDPERRGPWIAR